MPRARLLALALAPLGATMLAVPAQEARADGLRLCGAEAKTSEYQDLALYDSGAGLSLQQVPVDEMVDELSGYAAKSGGVACAKATVANLAVAFPGQDAALLAGPVSIASTGTALDLLDPALCTSYAAPGTGMTLVVTDTNGATAPLAGWAALRYDLASRRFEPSAMAGLRGPLVQCHSFPWNQLLSNPPEYGAPGPNLGIFDGSFENRGNLRVEIIDPETDNRTGTLEVTQNLPFSYRLRVSNIGESVVSGVRIREFLPQLTLTPVVSAGSWTCTRSSGACATASGTGAIALDGLSLARDESITFEITRELPGAQPGANSLVAAAAFVDPSHATGGGEEDPEDNAQPLVLTVVANQAPSITCAPTTLTTLVEDGGATAVSCTATDADGDAVTSMAVVDTTATGSPVALSGTVNSAGSLSFDVTPNPQAHGSTTLHVTAQDALGATSAPYAIPVTVASVNDAPTVTAFATTIVLSPTGAVPTDENGASLDDGTAHLVSRSSDCGNSGADGCAVTVSPFFEGIGSGAANENQSVTGANPFVCTTESGTSVSSAFYTRPGSGAVSGGKSDLHWIYSKSMAGGTTINCEAVFTDAGGASSSQTITFIMGPLPPP